MLQVKQHIQIRLPKVRPESRRLGEWGKLTVTWWTHSIKGLHKNDFIMATKTDQLL